MTPGEDHSDDEDRSGRSTPICSFPTPSGEPVSEDDESVQGDQK